LGQANLMQRSDAIVPSGVVTPAANIVAALTQDATLLGTLRAAVDSAHKVVAVKNEAELAPHLLSGAVAAALLDSAAIDGDLAAVATRLRAQFPDLVLVVVGDARDQARVAAQITSGDVYRFLHRPISAQRIRLFVDAALRRHDVEHAEHLEHTGEIQRPVIRTAAPTARLPLLVGGALLAALAAVGLWLSLRPGDATKGKAPTPVVTAADAGKERVRAAVAAIDAAVLRGELLEPAGTSALSLASAAANSDPGNGDIKAAGTRVVDRLLGAAEQAIIAENPDEAQRYVDAAATLAPGTTRGAFLLVQIAKERERGALTRARESARNSGSDQGREYLRLANQSLRAGNLIEPTENNARFYLEAARSLLPNDPGVTRAARNLQTALLERARTAAAAGDNASAERWLANAEEAAAARGAVSDIRRALQQSAVVAKAETITQLTQSFAQAFSAGRLLEPAAANAKSFYVALNDADATHPATRDARERLGKEFLREARIAIGRSDTAGAERWLGEARSIGVAVSELAAVERESQAAAPAAVISAGNLRRTNYVAPRYPAGALNRGRSGWVDLEFTVTIDGTVTGVTALAAEPTGVFENSAIEAVQQWRYQPVMRDGQAVEQRARQRVRFAVE
jgi:TonB family protein